jgi:hypothetical protein
MTKLPVVSGRQLVKAFIKTGMKSITNEAVTYFSGIAVHPIAASPSLTIKKSPKALSGISCGRVA